MRRLIVGALAGILLTAGPATPVGEDRLEYQVKAAFLFNFLKFIEWPTTPGDMPWVIGVLGHDSFGDVLDQTVRGKLVNGRPVIIRRYGRMADVKDCNILFVGHADYEHLGIPSIVGLLTVGEAPGFLRAGGAINFYLEDGHVRFEIKAASARIAGLRVSSQLLKLGRAAL